MKFIRTSIISLILSILCAATVFAAQGSISFSDPTVTVGNEVNVTMKVSADEGTVLDKADIMLTYPSSNLEFVSGTDAEGGAGAIRVHGTTNGGGTSQLEYNLRFKTSSAGTFNIQVDRQEIYDVDDQVIELTHVGSSAVTVRAEENASTDSSLSSLDVYPGTLEPAFTSDNYTYSVTVGLDVTQLVINAVTTDGTANVKISNNENLPEGDSAVIVTVNAADGTSSQDYTINVSKVEGGASNTVDEPSAPTAEGVQLSSKGKTITIMNPSPDVEVPEGFKQGTISIDDQKVQGWVWGATDSPEYCVVYGMNDKGEINFYRYDMMEKTIQRYFEDPLSANSVSNAEYAELEAEKEAAERTAESRLIIMVVIAVIAFAAIMAAIYLWFKLQTSDRMQKSYRKQTMTKYARKLDEDTESESDDGEITKNAAELEASQELLKHDFTPDMEESTQNDASDETQVIRRPERKRRPRRVRSSEGSDMIVSDVFEDGTTTAADDDDVRTDRFTPEQERMLQEEETEDNSEEI